MIKGIDVSGWNPEVYPTTGIDFVVVKATEGTGYVNPKQGRQTMTARRAGLVVGFYHFLHPGDIEAQARHFVDKSASHAGDFFVCDWETTAAGKRPSSADKDAFIRAVRRLRPGHKVGLYCNTDYWLHEDDSSFAGDFLWIADPGTAGRPRIAANWLFHQYAVTGGTDRNVAKFADRAALRAWAVASVPPKPRPKPTPPPAHPFPTGIRPGASSPSARGLQRALKLTGWLDPHTPESDTYGPLTRQGVAGFNGKHLLNSPGVMSDPAIGPRGWALLMSLAYGAA